MKRSAGLVFLALVLAGCSSDQGEQPGFERLFLNAVLEARETRRAGPQPKVVVTPQMLAQTQEAALQVNPEKRGGSDFLRRAATRRDSAGGTVEIWRSSDNAQIFLRNGVVVGTRGIGGDIIAADASVTVNALAQRGTRSGVREYVISDGDVTTTVYQLRCAIEFKGSENITVVNQVIATDHMQEACTGGPLGQTVLTNDYWVDRSTDTVRKSRQWMGPQSEYFEMILLKN